MSEKQYETSMSLTQVCKAAREETGEKLFNPTRAAEWVRAKKIRKHAILGLKYPRFYLSEFIEDYYKNVAPRSIAKIR